MDSRLLLAFGNQSRNGSGVKKAPICGVSGQDGGYLAQLLLQKDYKVYGTSRNARLASFENLKDLGIRDKIEVESLSGILRALCL